MNSIAKYSASRNSLDPGTPEQIKVALAALIKTFPCGPQESPDDKIAGYIETLQGEPAWAVASGSRKFIHGKVADHDGRFLPTSAQLGKVVRKETEPFRDRIASERRVSETQKLIGPTLQLTSDQMSRRAAQVSQALAQIGKTVSHNDVLFTPDGRARKWPDGTTFEAKRGIITHPTGNTISYADWWEQKQAKARA